MGTGIFVGIAVRVAEEPAAEGETDITPNSTKNTQAMSKLRLSI
jgi:hypothetical protein